MEIVFVREKQSATNILQQVKNSVISRIQQAVNLANNNSESMILPIVPSNIPFKTVSPVENYEGFNENYSIPDKTQLSEFGWSSIFPVNKAYPYQHAGSNNNGYEYVEFLKDRQDNILPFRLIAWDISTHAGYRVYYDDFVVVKDFQFQIDNVGDIQYTLTLNEFNSNLPRPSIDLAQAGLEAATNTVTRFALQNAGLI